MNDGKSAPEIATTGIGSLPHHNIDAALAFSFKRTIPFLPQIPIRNPWEFMIASALEGLPGLQVESDGRALLNPDIWASRAAAFEKLLTQAFARASGDRDAFSAFEPSSATSSSWQAFLWELREKGRTTAKVQISGPLTAQWALGYTDGTRPEQHDDVTNQIPKLVLARAFAMTRRMQDSGIAPILFFDEPALYAYSSVNPRHLAAFQELKLMISTLRKENVAVGLHCCSNADWSAILSLDLSYLSLDTALSLGNLLTTAKPAFLRYLKRGGRLSLGVIPTGRSSALHSMNVGALLEDLKSKLSQAIEDEASVRQILLGSLYTPACGLALQSIEDAEWIAEALDEFARHLEMETRK